MTEPITKPGLLIHGKSLPTAKLAKLFNLQPFVIRNERRKGAKSKVLEVGEPEAAYCAFHLPLNNPTSSISEALYEVLPAFRSALEFVSHEPSVESAALHMALYSNGLISEVLENQVFQLLQQMRLGLRLDCYFTGCVDLINPPDSLVNSAPEGTVWFGGGMDLISLGILSTRMMRGGVSDLNDDLLQHLQHKRTCSTIDDIPNALSALVAELNDAEVADVDSSPEAPTIYCGALAYRSNREIEFNGQAVSTIADSQYDLLFSAAHVSHDK